MSAPIRRDIKAALCAFVHERFLVELGTDFDTETNLFDAQIIDSFGFVELVRFLEKEFTIKLHDEDLVSGELTSIDSMASLVARRADERIHA